MAKNLEKAPKATPATLAERKADSAEPTSTSAVTVDSTVSDSLGKYLSPLHHDAHQLSFFPFSPALYR